MLGWVQTTPNGGNLSTLTLPGGQVGYVVQAVSGIPMTITSGQIVAVSGTGTVKLNQRNNSTTGTISYNDGAGHSGTANTYLTQFTMTWNGAGGPATFFSFCVDLFHTVGVNQTYAATARGTWRRSSPTAVASPSSSRTTAPKT
jgi:hypothetical protein